MAIGPVQLIVLGFNHPDFHRDIIAELQPLVGRPGHPWLAGARGRIGAVRVTPTDQRLATKEEERA
jgi:hypothetical protein